MERTNATLGCCDDCGRDADVTGGRKLEFRAGGRSGTDELQRSGEDDLIDFIIENEDFDFLLLVNLEQGRLAQNVLSPPVM